MSEEDTAVEGVRVGGRPALLPTRLRGASATAGHLPRPPPPQPPATAPHRRRCRRCHRHRCRRRRRLLASSWSELRVFATPASQPGRDGGAPAHHLHCRVEDAAAAGSSRRHRLSASSGQFAAPELKPSAESLAMPRGRRGRKVAGHRSSDHAKA